MTDRPPAERAVDAFEHESAHCWVCQEVARRPPNPHSFCAEAEVARLRELTKRVFVGPCVHGRDPYERCDVDDVPAGVIPCGELEWWEAAGRCGDRALEELRAEISALRSQLAAERDAAVAMASLREDCNRLGAARDAVRRDAARAEEREACAQVVEAQTLNQFSSAPARRRIAAAIRARGAK